MDAAAPLVSIVTPTYNHEAYIGECIESVLAQTYPNWEMIVVDDGSTDGTREAIARYADPRIRLVVQVNKGIDRLGETYNAALGVARGELVAILEGDDYWPPYKLAMQVPAFEDEGVVLCSGFTSLVEGEDCLGVTPPEPPRAVLADNRPVGVAAKVMMNPATLTYTFPVSTVLRRSALDRLGGFVQPPYLPLVDFPTFLQMTTQGEFRFLPHVLGFWRRHAASTTRSRLPVILDGVYRYCAEFVETHRPELALTDAEVNELSRLWQHFEAQRCTLRGRLLSAEKKYRKAALAFRQAERYERTAPNRVASRMGVLLSSLHLPCEWFYRLMGRAPVQKVVNVGAGDVLVAEGDLDRPRQNYRWRFGD